MEAQNDQTQNDPIRSSAPTRKVLIDLALISAVVLASFFFRLTDLPIVGEEGRRARGAVNMLETGDWIVVRQQGLVFPDRPPMTNWLIAITSFVTGEVDKIAIRLPSTIAILLTAFLIYGYGRTASTRLAAFSASLVYVTFGQVLQLGRLGESEAVFALFVSASLLIWHLGYLRGWSWTLIWSLGYLFAALATLSKGIQAPVYFCAPVFVFLLYRRQWRQGLTLAHAVGILVFITVLGAWQVPYYLATDWTAVEETWFDVVGPRLGAHGLLMHLVEYPLETFGCLLPWSPLLLLLFSSRVRRGINCRESVFAFLIIAIVMTYPSVWFAAGAKGRYYIPMYPIFGLIIGLIINEIATAEYRSAGFRFWRHTLRTGIIIAGGAGITLVLGLFIGLEQLRFLSQSPGIVAIFVTSILLAITTLVWNHRNALLRHAFYSMAAFSLFVGMFYNCIVVSMHNDHWHDLTVDVNNIKKRLDSDTMVSFGPVDHRFAYPYRDFIAELTWPEQVHELPADVKYFCFNRTKGDSPERRVAQRGMKMWHTPGTLPFQWKEIGRVCCDRKVREDPDLCVIVGQVIRTPAGEAVASRDEDTSWK